MTTSVVTQSLFTPLQAQNAETTQYASPANTRVIIDKFTACNTTGTAATLSVKLVPSGGTAGTTNAVMSAISIAAGATYLCPEVTGHTLNPGDFISTLAGTASAITIRASGRAIS